MVILLLFVCLIWWWMVVVIGSLCVLLLSVMKVLWKGLLLMVLVIFIRFCVLNMVVVLGSWM